MELVKPTGSSGESGSRPTAMIRVAARVAAWIPSAIKCAADALSQFSELKGHPLAGLNHTSKRIHGGISRRFQPENRS